MKDSVYGCGYSSHPHLLIIAPSFAIHRTPPLLIIAHLLLIITPTETTRRRVNQKPHLRKKGRIFGPLVGGYHWLLLIYEVELILLGLSTNFGIGTGRDETKRTEAQVTEVAGRVHHRWAPKTFRQPLKHAVDVVSKTKWRMGSSPRPPERRAM